jgi:hypothetical protein
MNPLTEAYACVPKTSITVVGNSELYPAEWLAGLAKRSQDHLPPENTPYVTTNAIHKPVSFSIALASQKATTVMALPSTLITRVFCLPATSAMKPIMIRLAVFMPLLMANNAAPKAAVYPRRVENSDRKFRGTRFPPAWSIAAIACNMNAGLLAILRLTNVGRLVRLRDGGVAQTIGTAIAKLVMPNIRKVHRMPVFVSSKRVIGA